MSGYRKLKSNQEETMKKAIGFAAVFLLAASSWAVAGPVESRFDVKIGGYVKLDAIHQDANVGALRGALGTLGALPSAANADRDTTNFTARQSRLNLAVTGPEAFGAKTKAFLEGDFFGQAGRNQDGNFRLRHATFSLAWANTELMFGQFWDIFGPLAASTLDFGTGNNIGAPNSPRVAQVRLTHKLNLNEGNALKFILGLQDPLQDDQPISSTDSRPVAFETENPAGNIAGQLIFESKALGVSPGYWGLPMQPLSVTLFGQYGKANYGDGLDVDAWGAGVFTHVPVLKSSDGKSRAGTLSFQGQVYMAEGMSWNQATASRTIGAGPTLEGAEGYGAIGQLIYYPTQPLGITAGYGRRGVVDNANYRAKAVAGTASRSNDAYFVNVARDWGNVRLAAEYMRLEGKYFDAVNDADANRFQFSAMYFF
jgi:hypothetical protein